jgi:hypothetical protein
VEVSRAAALVLAYAIDPQSLLKPPEPPSGLDPLAAASAEPDLRQAATEDDRAAPTRSARDRLSVAVEGRGLAGVGLLPSLAWGVGGAATLRRGWLGLVVFGQYWFSQSERVVGQGDKGGTFDLLGGGMAVSVVALRRPVLVEPFVGLELDHLRARGLGVDVPRDAAATSVALLAGGTVTLSLSPHLVATAAMQGGMPSSRRQFVLDEIGRVYQPARMNGRFVLGAGWRF